ncbi:MAG: hypothetical protein OP8BY_1364 [Candidatus Saccharicenans subterraneus]|uniref:Uncharacterized protein n=1 Tax=Candidatus Saccharicenans subterraneus TaxID=2508984 RepID=A0A3E2BPX8_9BACT|nr:MAG: hypothetical protein OP8BY_1364 [Candidatus Saccharicenans subterraneum]
MENRFIKKWEFLPIFWRRSLALWKKQRSPDFLLLINQEIF